MEYEDDFEEGSFIGSPMQQRSPMKRAGPAEMFSPAASIPDDNDSEAVMRLKAQNNKLRQQLKELNTVLAEQLAQNGDRASSKARQKSSSEVLEKELRNAHAMLEQQKRSIAELKKALYNSANTERMIDLENRLAEQRQDLDRLVNENRGLLAIQREQSKALESLGAGDEASRALRAAAEDVRVLKDKCRKYAERAQEAERTVRQQHDKLLQVQDRLKRATHALSAAGVSVDAVPAQDVQKIVSEKDALIKEMEHKIDILKKSNDQDKKRTRSQLTSALNEIKRLNEEVELLRNALTEKDKELKLNALNSRAKAGIVVLPPSKPSAAAAKLQPLAKQRPNTFPDINDASDSGAGDAFYSDDESSSSAAKQIIAAQRAAGSRIPKPGQQQASKASNGLPSRIPGPKGAASSSPAVAAKKPVSSSLSPPAARNRNLPESPLPLDDELSELDARMNALQEREVALMSSRTRQKQHQQQIVQEEEQQQPMASHSRPSSSKRPAPISVESPPVVLDPTPAPAPLSSRSRPASSSRLVSSRPPSQPSYLAPPPAPPAEPLSPISPKYDDDFEEPQLDSEPSEMVPVPSAAPQLPPLSLLVEDDQKEEPAPAAVPALSHRSDASASDSQQSNVHNSNPSGMNLGGEEGGSGSKPASAGAANPFAPFGGKRNKRPIKI